MPRQWIRTDPVGGARQRDDCPRIRRRGARDRGRRIEVPGEQLDRGDVARLDPAGTSGIRSSESPMVFGWLRCSIGRRWTDLP